MLPGCNERVKHAVLSFAQVAVARTDRIRAVEFCVDTLHREVPSVGFQPPVQAKSIAKVRRSIGLFFAILLFLAGCAQSIQLHSVDWGGDSVDLPAWLS